MHRGRCLLLTLVVVLSIVGPPSAAGQEPPQSPPEVEAPAAGTDTTFASLGYGTAGLRGTYGSADYFLPRPIGQRITGAEVAITFTASPLLAPRSSLTVLANGVPLASTRPAGAAPRSTLSAVVPPELVGADGLVLQVAGYLRLTDDDCEETDNVGQWVTIADDSTVRFTTTPAEPDLADLPELLAPGAEGMRFTLSDASPEVLTAAGVVAWQSGRWHAERQLDPVVTTSEDARSQIEVGLDAEADGPVLGVRSTDPIDLQVVGRDADDLAVATEALVEPATVGSLAGPARVLTGQAASAAPDRARPWTAERTTFAQLGLPQRQVTGLGTREVAFAIDRPAGWQIGGRARLDLVLDAGAGLDPASSVQVLVNGIDAGTRRLRVGDGPATSTFRVDGGLLDRRLDGTPVRTLDLTLRFVLDLPEGRCSAVDPAAAQVTILPTSGWTLDHEDAEQLDLARFPAPLGHGDDREPVVIVIRNDDEASVTAGLQLAAALGRFDPTAARPPELVTRAQFDRAPDLADRDVVLLGEDEDGTAGTAEPGPDEALATIEIGPSPFDDAATAIVVRGDAEATVAAARALSSRPLLVTLAGRRAAVLDDRATTVVGSAGTRPPKALATVDAADDELRNWALPALVTLAVLLLVLLAVVRFRWRSGGRKRRG